ncbi:hypothetical protein HK102_005534 [Quaeritorhiza haematococci]|nr:hypothetical protein HK102_005534 [Quaeritorhiza haematococci]
MGRGGMVVWRMCLWQPTRVRAVVSLCTPYNPPQKKYRSNEDLVAVLPNFSYQLYLSAPETDAELDQHPDVFLAYVLRGADEAKGFRDLDMVVKTYSTKKIERPCHLSEEEFKYYVETYRKRGFHGALNLYRTRKVNFDEELDLKTTQISHRCLMVAALRDDALPPSMSASMPRYVPNLTMKFVDAGHFVQVEKKDEINDLLFEWLNGLSDKKSSKL